MWMLENAFLIPLIPTISFVVILFFGKRYIGADRVHVVGTVSYTHLTLPTIYSV